MSEYERSRVSETPDGPVRETYREVEVRRGDSAGWWIAAVVAMVAVIGLVFLLSNQNRQDQLLAARDQGAAQARIEGAASDAQRAAMQATQSAQMATDSSARATQRAAEAAQIAANQTAQTVRQSAESADDAGRDASTVAPQP